MVCRSRCSSLRCRDSGMTDHYQRLTRGVDGKISADLGEPFGRNGRCIAQTPEAAMMVVFGYLRRSRRIRNFRCEENCGLRQDRQRICTFLKSMWGRPGMETDRHELESAPTPCLASSVARMEAAASSRSVRLAMQCTTVSCQSVGKSAGSTCGAKGNAGFASSSLESARMDSGSTLAARGCSRFPSVSSPATARSRSGRLGAGHVALV